MRLPSARAVATAAAALALAACMPPASARGHAHGTADHAADHDDEEADRDAPWVEQAASRVLLLQAATAGQPTEVIGILDVHEEVGRHDEALHELRRKAARLGADAVIGIDFRHGPDDDEPTHLSGVAVRFRDLVRGRPYDVLAVLDVAGEMGREAEALDRLRAKARQLGADLVIHVEYRHGPGGAGSSHVVGKAIRFRPAPGPM